MWVYIKNEENEKVVGLRLPASEEKIAEALENIIVDNNMSSKIIVDYVEEDMNLNKVLKGNEYNLTDLNMFFRLYSSLDRNQMKVFSAVVETEGINDIKDLMNLSMNVSCYDLITDFKDAEKLAKEIHFNRYEEINMKKFNDLDKVKFINDVLRQEQSPKISSFGVVCRNNEEYHLEFNGVNYPSFIDDYKPVFLGLRYDDKCEYFSLPTEMSELNKALERLGADSYEKCEKFIDFSRLSKTQEQIIDIAIDNFDKLNIISKELYKLGDLYEVNTDAIDFIDIKTPDELLAVASELKFIEIDSNVKSYSDYGLKYVQTNKLIDEKGIVADFIDYDELGKALLFDKDCKFTDKGMIIYTGYNHDMINLFNEKYDMKIEREFCDQEIKYYLPLKVTSFYDENCCGDFEVQNYTIEVDINDISGYEKKLNEELSNLTVNHTERGLMEYYKTIDLIDRKVHNLHFAFEEVNGTIYGVAICKTFALLNKSEESKLKDYIISQASDGVGESFEQQEIELDGRTVNVSLWNRDWDWELIEESEMNQNEMGMGGM